MKRELKGAVLAALLCTSPALAQVGAQAVDAGTVRGQYDVVMANVKVDPEMKNVITRQELDAKGARNLEEALTGEQDVQFIMDEMGKRTVSIRGAEPRHVVFLVDGMRLASGLSKLTGPGDDMYRIGMDDVDHVEVSLGATASKYGSDAMGGVVNVITKVPDKAGVRTNMEWSYIENSKKSQFNHNITVATGKIGPFKGEIGWSKVKTEPYLYGDQNDSIQYYGLRYPTDVKGEFDLKSAGTLRLDYNKLHEDLSKSTKLAEKNIPMGPGMNMSIYEFLQAKEIQDSERKSIRWSKSFDKADVSVRHYSTELWNDTDFMAAGWVKFPKVPDNYHQMPYFDTYHTKVTGNEATISLSPNDKHRVSFTFENIKDFGEGTRINVQGKGNQNIVRKYMWPAHDAKDFSRMKDGQALPQGYEQGNSVYPKYINSKEITSRNYVLSDDINISDKLHATAVLRYDTNSQFGNRLSPKLGLTYLVNPTLRYKANVGTAFSTPGVTELYHDWEMYPPSLNPEPPFKAGWYFKGNPDLKPEKAVNFDVSVEAERGKTATKFTLFRNTFRDFLQISYIGHIDSPVFGMMKQQDTSAVYFDSANPGPYASADDLKAKLKAMPSDDARLGVVKGLKPVVITPIDDLYTYKNLSHVRMQGAELSVTHQFSKSLTAKAGYTYLDARDTDTDKRLEGRGRNLFSLSLQYNDVKHGFRTTFYGNYTTNYLDLRDRVEVMPAGQASHGHGAPGGHGPAGAPGGHGPVGAPGGHGPVGGPSAPAGGSAATSMDPISVIHSGPPVYVFGNKAAAEAFAQGAHRQYSYSKQKVAREKNYGVWNLMVEKDVNKYATVYAGINNIFGASDEFLGLGGRVYKMGFKAKF